MPDPFRNSNELRRGAEETFGRLVDALLDDLRGLLLTPELQIDYSVIEAYASLVESTVRFGKAISASNPGYWRRDLPPDVSRDLARIEHAVKLLLVAYAPAQAATAKSV